MVLLNVMQLLSNLRIDAIKYACQQTHQPIDHPVLEQRGHLLKYSIHAINVLIESFVKNNLLTFHISITFLMPLFK